MKKIPSIFVRDFGGNACLVTETPNTEAAFVFEGLGIPTRKFDGTCCRVLNGKLWKRLDCKRGKTPPANFEQCGPADPVTGHHVGWIPVGDEPDSRWHREAFDRCASWGDGTYELCGPKLQANPEGFPAHTLVVHGSVRLLDVPLTFVGLKEYLKERLVEGIVWHHKDGTGEMAKIKRTDFGWPWPVPRNEEKVKP